ncbi:PKD domain-containing protein [Phaeodactylibacter xiamenensis]|uniref:PKD domain-containing protein n=1 Tax=Phaeodactylibacter xiamenensis TaxID=1524460 RepID=UPI003BABA511
MKAIFFLLFVLGGVFSQLYAQETFAREPRDHIWLFGYDGIGGPPFASTVMDFNTNPVSVFTDTRQMNFEMTNASICDTLGELEVYTNGLYIADAAHDTITNGSGLNPDPYTDFWIEIGAYSLQQSALFFKAVDGFHLLHTEMTKYEEEDEFGSPYAGNNLYLTEVKSGETGYEVGNKNQVLVNDTLVFGQLTGCRHANGQDWWLIVPEYMDNQYYSVLITPDSVAFVNKYDSDTIFIAGVGQANFTPDGSKYVRFSSYGIEEGQFIEIYDFDRCDGYLYNPRVINYNDTAYFAGAAISENSRFLYISSHRYIYQYDLEAEDIEASKVLAAEYDGFESPANFGTRFFLAQLAPDGKIYISTPGATDRLHVIHQPNNKGAGCQIEQHGIQLPGLNFRTMPNHPYYGLGPEDGGACDTLGIDLPLPEAEFSYVVTDSSLQAIDFYDGSKFQPYAWHWDFGDGAVSNSRHPQHSYIFPALYEACLTATNAQGSHTSCQEIDLRATSTTTLNNDGIYCRAFPNPASTILRVECQIQHTGLLQVFNMRGQEVYRKSIAHNPEPLQLDVRQWPAGVYSIRLSDGYNSQLLQVMVE